MSRNDNEAKTAAYFAIASGAAAQMQAYLQRGRPHEHANAEQLRLLFVRFIRQWAADPLGWPDRWQLDDVQCEYEIRGLTPPFDVVKDDLERIIAAIDAGVAQLDPNEKDEINQQMLSDYNKAKKLEN